MRKQVQRLSLVLFAFLFLGGAGNAWSQINLAGGVYQENFDGMGATGNTMPVGWTANRLAGSGPANEFLPPNPTDGNVSSGAMYNVGQAGTSERALGTLSSGTTAPAFGVSFKNTSGASISRLDVSAFMEQWKTATRTDQLESVVFEYSTNATNLYSGTWTAVPALDLVEKLTESTVGEAINGNAAANRTAISGSIAITLADQAIIWFRWKDTDVIGSDGLYALDDLVVTPAYTVVDNTAPTLQSTTPANGATNVSTALDMVLRFSEPVIAGTGRVTLTWNGGSMSLTATDPAIVYNGNEVTIQNISLQPGVTYTGTVENTAFKDYAGNFFAGITGNSLTFTTSATGTPVITTNETALTFSDTQVGRVSEIKGYDLSVVYPQGNVTVTATGPFQLSKSNSPATFSSNSLVFTPSELATTKAVYVRFAPTAVTGNSGTITHTAAGAQPVTLTLSGSAFSVLTQDFNTCSSALPGGWSQFSVTGNQTWNCTTFGRSGNAVQMSGFAGGNQLNEDWLISPGLDLSTGFTYPLLSFWSRTAFAGSPLKLMVSTNYSGTGNPTAPGVVWTELNGMFPAPASDVWTQSSSIDLSAYKQDQVYLAFVYNSTTAAAPRWTLDDFAITNSTTIPPASLSTTLTPLTDADFGLLAPGAIADKSYSFSIQSLYSPVTLTAPQHFTLSKNGVDFSQSITFSQAEGAANSFTVRFTAPAATNSAFAGPITFRADNLNQQVGFLTAGVLNKENTFDVVTWNIEWFGAPNQGPSNENLQRDNVKKVIESLDADVFAFQEISNATAFDNLKALLPAYEGFMSQYSSGSQEVAYFYKRATVREIQRKYLLRGTTGISNFWASGRYPYLLEIDATINGVTKRLHLINIHAKANENNSPADALNAYNRRKIDVAVLKDSLDRYYPNASIIMLGDYNDDLDVTVADITSTTESTYKMFVDDAARYTFPTLSLSQAGLRSYVTRDDVIDHIMYSNELANFYVSNSARLSIPFATVGAATAQDYTNTTSDHLPVLARFVLADPNGLEEQSWVSGFKVYPNPTHGQVVLQVPANVTQGGSFTLEVYDLQGKLIFQEKGTEEMLNKRLSQALEGASAGMYLLKAVSGTKTYQSRIIKR